MKKYNSNQPLISLHLPKTGGRSFRIILETWFGQNLYDHYASNNTLPTHHPTDTPFSCIHGHFNSKQAFGALDYYPKNKQYVTLLRDPLKRQISYYRYMHFLKDKGLRDPSLPIFKYNSLDKFLNSCKPTFMKFFPSDMNENNYKDYIQSNFVSILILEKFQESVNHCASSLNKIGPKVPHKNKSGNKKESATPSTIKKFKVRNKFEYELYDYAANMLTP